jgi:predicted aconitase
MPPALPTLRLDDEERAMLAGEFGEATAMAMRILSRLAPLYGATGLLPVTRAHIDGCIYEGDAGLAFAERLAATGGTVRVPTTLNVISLDRARWQALGQDADYASRARRLGEAYLAMGALPTFTCAPYQHGHRPDFGEQIAWAESNAVGFANTVCGARTNRYGDYLDISCALAGRVPAAGLHLDAGRRATAVLRLPTLPAALTRRDDFWPVLGYLVGGLADDDIIAVDGLDASPTEDQLKAFAAAAASSGAVALCHLVGITPEAPDLVTALQGEPPRWERSLTMADLRAARDTLTTTSDRRLDLVAFGSPHCSLAECRELAALMADRQVAPGVDVWITTSRAVRDILAATGGLATLEAFGAKVTADTCIVVAPLARPGGVMMTNSAKYAHYGPGIIGVDSVFGDTAECVASAIAGHVVREDGPWA